VHIYGLAEEKTLYIGVRRLHAVPLAFREGRFTGALWQWTLSFDDKWSIRGVPFFLHSA
jgi:hypothetical protein